MRIELVVLWVVRALGLFALARAATAEELRILCYHGASFVDEHRFRPGLFMTPETFASRMQHLARKRYPVLPLDEALDRLRSGRLPPCATVITIDDGWYGTHQFMAPILKSFAFPATLYVATYYMEKGTQVFNVALSYALWSASRPVIDLAQVSPDLSGLYNLADARARADAERRILTIADKAGGALERQQLLRRICEAAGVDWRNLEKNRLLAFMNAGEARELLLSGIDIQLHTHRHRFPKTSPEELSREIEDNRRSLSTVTGAHLHHLCYPSGEYLPETFSHLERMGIQSGTTTKRGMNTDATPKLELRRLLDSESTPAVKFEAEVSGFLELCRRALARAGLRPVV